MDSIESKEAFVNFVRTLATDYKSNPSEWENKDLGNFLEALANWTEDMEGYYAFKGKPIVEAVPWRVFADCLMGAKMYE